MALTHESPAGTAVFARVVAALHAAGDDAEVLADAIAAAESAGLNDIPGEDRQKLRAARTRLRKIHDAAAAAAAAEAAGVERSPFARVSYDTADFERLTGLYEGLKWRLLQKPGGASVKPDDFYRLYALHMQATRGDNIAERPTWAERGGLDFEGRARWDAWTALKGLPSPKAQERFVRLFWEAPVSVFYADTRAGLVLTSAADGGAAVGGAAA